MKKWEKNIRRVVPYTPGEQPNIPGMIKLNTNENPYPPAPGVRHAMEEMKEEQLRLYPDPASSILIHALAEFYHRPEEQFFVGVGSDDVLAMAFQTFFNSNKPILFPDITYSFYPVWAELFRIPYECPSLDSKFRIVKEDYLKDNGGIIFPNPNAPTGLYMGIEEVEEIVRQNPDVIVIVDEAYIDFGGASALPLLEKYENLLIVRTFSKSRSLAGLRIGYAIGSPELIQAMNDVKYSFNSYTMNRPALQLGTEALKDESYFQETIHKIMDTRTWFGEEMKKLGFSFPDSKANFIFATREGVSAEALLEAAKSRGIYVRHFKQSRINQYLRITIGTDEQMKIFLDFLKDYLKQV